MARICVAVVVLALAASGFGATYYVSTSGSDSNPGTQSQPWATLQKGVDTIANGDTVLVTPGTYAGCRIRYGAAAGSPKTLTAQTAGTVLINTPGALCRRPSNIEIISDDFGATPTPYWIIEGLEVVNSPKWGIDGIAPVNITVRNNVAHNNGTSANCTGIHLGACDGALVENNISYSNAEHGIYTCNSADNGVVRGNTLYSNGSMGHHMNGDAAQGGDGIMTGWLVEKNKSYNNGTQGFDGDGVEYTTWKNNLAYDNGSKGIHLCVVNGKVNPRYDKVYNNTLITKVGAYYCLTFYKGNKVKIGGNNNSAMNNILYNYDINNSMRGSIMYVSAWMSTFTSDYNVTVNRFAVDDNKTKYTLAQWQALGKDVHSTLCVDATALFVDAPNKNFHLKSTSPAINAGTTLAEVTDDLEGTARPIGGGYDAGCYEQY